MINMRIVKLPAFTITGRKSWISGQDNDLFGRFWEQCRADGLLSNFREIQKKHGQATGLQTGGVVLGVSRVEKNPTNREFDYMIAIETPDHYEDESLETYLVPASEWAVFECKGKIPEALVASEIYAFTEWLPNSGYKHALAPEMEVYPARDGDNNCEFWLPIAKCD